MDHSLIFESRGTTVIGLARDGTRLTLRKEYTAFGGKDVILEAGSLDADKLVRASAAGLAEEIDVPVADYRCARTACIRVTPTGPRDNGLRVDSSSATSAATGKIWLERRHLSRVVEELLPKLTA